jgi:hypothetical protein
MLLGGGKSPSKPEDEENKNLYHEGADLAFSDEEADSEKLRLMLDCERIEDHPIHYSRELHSKEAKKQ